MCAFLGTVSIFCIFIKNYLMHVHVLTQLMHKNHPFVFGPEQLEVQEDLKVAIMTSPTLCPIDYHLEAPVILTINTSYITVGFILSQCNPKDGNKHYYVHCESIILNKCEACFSQPKL